MELKKPIVLKRLRITDDFLESITFKCFQYSIISMGLITDELTRMLDYWNEHINRRAILTTLISAPIVFFILGYFIGGYLHGFWEAIGGALFVLLLVTSSMERVKVINLLIFVFVSGIVLVLSIFTTEMSYLAFTVCAASLLTAIYGSIWGKRPS